MYIRLVSEVASEPDDIVKNRITMSHLLILRLLVGDVLITSDRDAQYVIHLACWSGHPTACERSASVMKTLFVDGIKKKWIRR